jgi:hypothetical protein
LKVRKGWEPCIESAEGLKTLFLSCGRAENMILELRKGLEHAFGVAEGLKKMILEVRKNRELARTSGSH